MLARLTQMLAIASSGSLQGQAAADQLVTTNDNYFTIRGDHKISDR